MEVEGQRRLHAGRLDEVGDVRLAVEVRGVSQDTRVARGFQMVPSSKQKWREKEMGVGMLSAASGRKTIHDGYPASSRRRDWPETQGRARGRGPRPPIRRSQTPGAAPGPRPAGARAGAGSAGDRGARGARCTGSSRRLCLCCRDPTFPSRPPTTDDTQSWFVSARHAAPGGLRWETMVR